MSSQETAVEIPALERHLKIPEISKLWGVSPDVVRRCFVGEAGVIKLTRPSRRKRRYCTLLVPISVVQRVHDRLAGAK
jgi:hypothetical protein